MATVASLPSIQHSVACSRTGRQVDEWRRHVDFRVDLVHYSMSEKKAGQNGKLRLQAEHTSATVQYVYAIPTSIT